MTQPKHPSQPQQQQQQQSKRGPQSTQTQHTQQTNVRTNDPSTYGRTQTGKTQQQQKKKP